MCRLSQLSPQDRSLRHSTLRMHSVVPYCFYFDGNTLNFPLQRSPHTTDHRWVPAWSYVSLTYKTWTTTTTPKVAGAIREEDNTHFASRIHQCNVYIIHTYYMTQTFSVLQYSETTFSLVIPIMMIGILITELIYLITITCLITLTIY